MPDDLAATSTVAAPTDWLKPGEVSEEFRVSVNTLADWRYKGVGPRFAKFGKHVRYRRSDLDAWVEVQLERSDSSSSGSRAGRR